LISPFDHFSLGLGVSARWDCQLPAEINFASEQGAIPVRFAICIALGLSKIKSSSCEATRPTHETVLQYALRIVWCGHVIERPAVVRPKQAFLVFAGAAFFKQHDWTAAYDGEVAVPIPESTISQRFRTQESPYDNCDENENQRHGNCLD
jgi:hypothetical protein